MPVVYGALDLSSNEIRNFAAHNLPTAPPNPVPGQLWYDTTANILKWWSGTLWVEAIPGAPGSTYSAGAGLVEATAGVFDVGAGNGVLVNADDIEIDTAVIPDIPAVEAMVDGFTITTVPTTSLTATKAGSTATGDLVWNLALDSLTLANTLTGVQADPNTPLIPGEPGDTYIDTALGTYWVSDGTTWTQITVPASAGITAITGGDGIAVDASTPAVPVVSAVIDPGSDPGLTVSAAGLSLAPLPTGLARKYAADLTGTGGTEIVTHDLNTTDIVLSVIGAAGAVEVDWEATTVNTATVRFTPDLGPGYRVVIVG